MEKIEENPAYREIARRLPLITDRLDGRIGFDKTAVSVFKTFKEAFVCMQEYDTASLFRDVEKFIIARIEPDPIVPIGLNLPSTISVAGYVVHFLSDGVLKTRIIPADARDSFMKKFGHIDPLHLNESAMDLFMMEFERSKDK